ncbi:MAG: insulinase family protein [Acidobacteria bacterium]|nr:insulinase family protein [Acidobacteriota bacterium]
MAKKIFCLILLAILAFTFAAQEKPKRAIDQIVYPKLNDIKPPQVSEFTLSNGIVVMLVENHEFPTVDIRAMIKGGKIAEPIEKNGLAQLFGDVLRSGGTKTMKSDDIDKYLDRIGASIESYAGESAIEIQADCLKENTDEVIKLFSDFLLAPAFEDEKIDLAKTQMRSMISRRNDEAMEVVSRELNKILYGKDSPYARQIEYWDVDNLKKEDLINYHQKYFRPDMTYIAVWGDFSAPEMKQKLEKYLGLWKIQGPKPEITLPAIPEQKYSVNQIEKKDVEQTFIFMGQLGLRYDDPDYAPTYIMTEILGGGFSSRLFKKVRTEMGLAYGAGSYMAPEFDHKGMFYFYTSTKPSTTSKALSAMLEEIKRIRQEPVTDNELKVAKEGFLNRYAFQFDSTAKLVNRMLTYKFYNYPTDFNKKIRDAVERVTKEDILRVAQNYLIPEKLTIVACGKVKEFDEPLSKYGAVNTIDITIPTGKKVEMASNPQAEGKAVELIKKAVKAIGEPAFNSLKDYYSEGKILMEGGEMPYKSYFIFPDKYAAELLFGEVSLKMAIDGESAMMFQGAQSAPMPESEAKDFRTSMWTEGGGLLLFKSVLEGKVKAQYLKEGTFGGNPAELVVVDTPQAAFLLFLDKKTGLLQAVRYEDMGEKGKEIRLMEVFKVWEYPYFEDFLEFLKKSYNY